MKENFESKKLETKKLNAEFFRDKFIELSEVLEFRDENSKISPDDPGIVRKTLKKQLGKEALPEETWNKFLNELIESQKNSNQPFARHAQDSLKNFSVNDALSTLFRRGKNPKLTSLAHGKIAFCIILRNITELNLDLKQKKLAFTILDELEKQWEFQNPTEGTILEDNSKLEKALQNFSKETDKILTNQKNSEIPKTKRLDFAFDKNELPSLVQIGIQTEIPEKFIEKFKEKILACLAFQKFSEKISKLIVSADSTPAKINIVDANFFGVKLEGLPPEDLKNLIADISKKIKNEIKLLMNAANEIQKEIDETSIWPMKSTTAE